MKSFALLLLLAACKSHDAAGTPPPPPAVGVPGEPPPSAAAVPARPPGSEPMDYSAPPECAPLTKADAEAVFGGPLPDPDMHPNPLGFQCGWKHHKPLGAVTMTLYTKGDAALFERNLAAGLLGKTPVAIPGAGERALKSTESNAFMILAHGKVAFVMIIQPASDPGPRIDAFATSLAGKL